MRNLFLLRSPTPNSKIGLYPPPPPSCGTTVIITLYAPWHFDFSRREKPFYFRILVFFIFSSLLGFGWKLAVVLGNLVPFFPFFFSFLNNITCYLPACLLGLWVNSRGDTSQGKEEEEKEEGNDEPLHHSPGRIRTTYDSDIILTLPHRVPFIRVNILENRNRVMILMNPCLSLSPFSNGKSVLASVSVSPRRHSPGIKRKIVGKLSSYQGQSNGKAKAKPP